MGKPKKESDKGPEFFVNSTKNLLTTAAAGALTSFSGGMLHIASGWDSLNKVMDMIGRQGDVDPAIEFELRILSLLVQNAQDRANSAVRGILQLTDHLGEGVLATVMASLGVEQANLEEAQEEEEERNDAAFAVSEE